MIVTDQEKAQGKAIDEFLAKRLDLEKRKAENKLTLEEWLRLPSAGY